MSNVIINDEYLSAIGDAIRTKNGTEDLIKPKDMANSILAITSGDIPEEAFNITGNCQLRFAYNGWNWFINEYGYNIKTKDIIILSSMFQNSTLLEAIPFEINCGNYSASTGVDASSMFSGCNKLRTIPKINNCKPSNIASIFANCHNIRYFPEDIGDWFDFSGFDNSTASYSFYQQNAMFQYCYSLRSIVNLMEFFKHENKVSSGAYSGIYYNTFSFCYTLDEIINFPINEEKWNNITATSNMFSNFIQHCQRLKNLTFETKEDGSPKIVKWKTQTIDLSTSVGYTSSRWNMVDYNSGITLDKQIKDASTYEALKNDPDCWTLDLQYSRYNHDSAVATINSLPDTSAYLASAGGTNTIKFKKDSGKLTDGGAINTLTEQEIAVATAKGWTVSLV